MGKEELRACDGNVEPRDEPSTRQTLRMHLSLRDSASPQVGGDVHDRDVHDAKILWRCRGGLLDCRIARLNEIVLLPCGGSV